MIAYLQRLGKKAEKEGMRDMLVGDIANARRWTFSDGTC